MVQILKNRDGFSIAEILVGTLILSIAVLAFFSTIKSSTKMGMQAKTNDMAYSIARQRLTLMQDGELLVRPSYKDSTERDRIMYYTFDEVDSVDSLLPLRLTVTVSWTSPTEKSVTLSGYLNREICPDTGVTTPPDSISISNWTIPEKSPANTFVGELKVHDPDTSDLHMYLFADSIQDNEFFKVEKGALYTADIMTPGAKKIELGVSDCAGNETKHIVTIDVVSADSVPHITAGQVFSVNENTSVDEIVGTVYATPTNLQFDILEQYPISPFSIGAGDGVLKVGAPELDYETASKVKMSVRASNLDWHDTETVLIDIIDVNEAPTKLTYTGLYSVDSTEPLYSNIGFLTTEDPDSTEDFTYTLTGSAYYFFRLDPLKQETLQVKLKPLIPGSYTADFKVTDKKGLSLSKSIVIAVTDPGGSGGSGGCGLIPKYEVGIEYIKGVKVYTGEYAYISNWITGEVPSLSTLAWSVVGACDGSATCADFPMWNNKDQYGGGSYVNHLGKIYRANSWNFNQRPPKSPWTEVMPCN